MGDRSVSLAATSAQSRAHPRSQTRRARIADRGAHTQPCAEPRGPTPSARSSRPSRSTLRVPLSTLGGPTRRSRHRNRMPPAFAAGLRRPSPPACAGRAQSSCKAKPVAADLIAVRWTRPPSRVAHGAWTWLPKAHVHARHVFPPNGNLSAVEHWDLVRAAERAVRDLEG